MYNRFMSFLHAFNPMRGVNSSQDTVCKSQSCWRILSCLRVDLRENPIKQWALRDVLIQSAGSISNSTRYHSDANIPLGLILKMYIPGQIRNFNALNSDGYSTGNAPPSGNNFLLFHVFLWYIQAWFPWTHSLFKLPVLVMTIESTSYICLPNSCRTIQTNCAGNRHSSKVSKKV